MPLVLDEPTEASTSQLKELGSRFFGYCYLATDQATVQKHLAALQKQYADATHICYAYRLGTDGATYRAADDGEPKYSAGTPILNQIKSASLTNILVAVVRYYGGTNLGVPGLVKAYGGTAGLALNNVARREALLSFLYHIELSAAHQSYVFEQARLLGHKAEIIGYTEGGLVKLELSGRGNFDILKHNIHKRLGSK